MSLWYLQCKPCSYLVSRLALSPNESNKAPQDPHQLGVPSGASNTISEPIVRLMQTVHQSCIKSSTIPKWTEPSFHLSHVTKESHRVRTKRFLCLWYVQRKPCIYLVSRLALSPNGPNRAPPDPRHLGVPSGASKLIYDPMVRLMQIVHLSCTDANTVSTHRSKQDSIRPT
jgi:hypothetical protein